VENGYAFALCRLPLKQTIRTFIAFDQPLFQTLELGYRRNFVFSPFNAGNSAFILAPSLYYEDEKLVYAVQSDPRQYAFLHQSSSLSTNGLFYPSVLDNQYTSEEHYTNLVRTSVEAIGKKKFRKIVAARCEQKSLGKNFDVIRYFLRLCEEYPAAFVYLYASPGMGTWIGATPEKLVTIDQGVLQTVALAGTLTKHSADDWSEKEREEQAFVEDFIANVFSKVGVSDFKKGNVQTVAAGNLRHLSSSFTWQADAEMIRKNFSSFLAELNPTPAVCGLPKAEAVDFLQQNEGFERRFYSGFAGVMEKEATNLFVNLRCMELMKDTAILYAGAGITSGSVAEKEWQETERKMQTLGSLF
jgi:isochorismate synthase